jgi:N4-gp56 family major capsid protein
MALTNFVPEIWSAALQANLKKALVARSIATTAWQGEIAGQGSVVKIQKPAQLTAAPYAGTITYATPTSSTLDLAIDQADYVAFKVSDVLQVQANVDLVSTYTAEAAYAIAKLTDTYVMGLAAGAGLAANEVEVNLAGAPSGWDDLYTKLVEAAELLDAGDAPREGRFVVASPRMMRALVSSPTFVTITQLSDQIRVNNSVGRIAGFDVVPSNNVLVEAITGAVTDGSKDVALYGVAGAVAYADQFMNMRAMELENSFDYGVSGLHLFGAKVIEPAALGRLAVTTVAAVDA